MNFPPSLILLALALPAIAQPYYVAPAGNDANSGTLEQPFATLHRAQQAVRQPGSVFMGVVGESVTRPIRFDGGERRNRN